MTLVPLRALRRIFCTTSLCACGQYHQRFEPPAVDDVADEIEIFGLVLLQEVEQHLGLAAARAQMDVREEDRAMAGSVVRTFDGSHVDNNSTDTKSVVRDCTNLSGLCMGAIARQ